MCMDKSGARYPAQVQAVKLLIPQEVRPEHFRDREDHAGVRYVGEDLLDHPLGPRERAPLSVGTLRARPGDSKKDDSREREAGSEVFGRDIMRFVSALVPQWVYAVSTPIIARSNESVAASDAGWMTVTNARESVQASRGGGANTSGIETAGEWGVSTYSDTESTKSRVHAYTSETQPSFHARRMHTSRTPHIFFADLRHFLRQDESAAVRK